VTVGLRGRHGIQQRRLLRFFRRRVSQAIVRRADLYQRFGDLAQFMQNIFDVFD
jgi:hypothetical protein